VCACVSAIAAAADMNAQRLTQVGLLGDAHAPGIWSTPCAHQSSSGAIPESTSEHIRAHQGPYQRAHQSTSDVTSEHTRECVTYTLTHAHARTHTHARTRTRTQGLPPLAKVPPAATGGGSTSAQQAWGADESAGLSATVAGMSVAAAGGSSGGGCALSLSLSLSLSLCLSLTHTLALCLSLSPSLSLLLSLCLSLYVYDLTHAPSPPPHPHPTHTQTAAPGSPPCAEPAEPAAAAAGSPPCALPLRPARRPCHRSARLVGGECSGGVWRCVGSPQIDTALMLVPCRRRGLRVTICVPLQTCQPLGPPYEAAQQTAQSTIAPCRRARWRRGHRRPLCRRARVHEAVLDGLRARRRGIQGRGRQRLDARRRRVRRNRAGVAA
jgi:hypothetical protein